MTITRKHPISGQKWAMPGYFSRICRGCERVCAASRLRKIKGRWQCQKCRAGSPVHE